MPITTFLDLEVYQLAREFAKEIFYLTTKFPSEEKYSLIDQVRRSSRSVAANIAEGWGKRVYINNFKRHLIDSNGSIEESKSWLLSALDCSYVTSEIFVELSNKANIIGSKLWKLHDTWQDFGKKT
jgi:four helix bundle protein